MRRKLVAPGLSVFSLCFLVGTAHAAYTLSLSVPLYGQDTSYYCGAASSQMIMMGYPSSSSRVCKEQTDIYNTIQTNKKDNGFYSDPDGVRDTIMSMNPPPAAGHFAIFSDANSDVVMHDMLYWMSKRQYPSAALINGGDHWVVVTGFQTDHDPGTGSAVLQSIDINDPLPYDVAPHDDPCTAANEGNEGGMIRHVTGTSWFSNDWKNANKWGTKWLNQFVAVVEPPEIQGHITAKPEAERGKVISPKEAIERAVREVRERKLVEKKAFAALKDTKAIAPSRALLVNRELKGYYIVPFESKDRKSPVAVLLNAYTGEFQEIGAFPKPADYIDAEEAIKIALCSARMSRVPGRPTAKLVYSRSEQTKSRYLPVWQVEIPTREGRLIRYVSQLGEVFIELTLQPYGGD